MFEKLPPEVQQFLTGIAGLIPMAVLARFMWHQQLVRMGKRKLVSWNLLTELPTAIFCAVLGGGIAQYFALGDMATHATVGAVSWLGPRGIETMIVKVLDRTPSQ